MSNGEKLVYSIDEVIRVCGISRASLYQEINRGALVVRKRGTRTLVLRSDLERYLEALPVYKTQLHANGGSFGGN